MPIENYFKKVIHDWVVIKKHKPEDKLLENGMYAPASAAEVNMHGTVIACGKGITGEPISVKVGDHVLFKEDAAIPKVIEGEQILMMREYPNIIAVI